MKCYFYNMKEIFLDLVMQCFCQENREIKCLLKRVIFILKNDFSEQDETFKYVTDSQKIAV